MLGGCIINKISDVIDRDVRKPITTYYWLLLWEIILLCCNLSYYV